MRTVSTCQIISSNVQSFDAAVRIAEDWAAAKFDESGAVPIIRRSGKEAIFTRAFTQVEDARRLVYQTDEEIEGGYLRTTFTSLALKGRVSMLCVQSIESNALVAPEIQLSLPRFIGEIIEECPGCRATPDGDQLFCQVFRVNNRTLEEFVHLLFSGSRVLPVVAISELDGQALTRDFPQRMAERIAGLAHVCLLSSEASWGLTEQYGKEWSAYNGAVKLYWPGAHQEQSGRRHPLWTYDWLAERHSTDRQAAAWLEQRLRETVFEASSYAVELEDFSAFERSLRGAQMKAQIAAAEEADSFRQLAETYASDAEELRVKLRELRDENGLLKAKLKAAYSDSSNVEGTAATPNSNEPPPATIAEAINTAKRRLTAYLMFPDDVNATSSGLNPTAGPPEKVLRYLEVLAEYARTLQAEKPLGKSVELWFRDRGVICSGESETTLGNKKEQEQRTWNSDGERITCNLHLKPSDGTSPDRCVRIYFSSPVRSKVPVGYIGRHF